MANYKIHFKKKNELYHHGVKGQKWGIRRYQDENGRSIIKKGTTVKRITASQLDPTFDNKKYVSLNEEDHSKWDKYYRDAYGRSVWSQRYETKRDLNVATATVQGRKYADMLMNDKKFAKTSIREFGRVENFGGKIANTKENGAEIISRHIALQTQTGHKFVQAMMKDGYNALHDTHGTNVSDIPVIVLNPNKNLKLMGRGMSDESWKRMMANMLGG